MNWNEIEGKWEQLKGSLTTRWGKLTDNDLTVIKGKRDQLLGKLQERYGYLQDKAEQEVEEFEKTYDCNTTSEKKDKSCC